MGDDAKREYRALSTKSLGERELSEKFRRPILDVREGAPPAAVFHALRLAIAFAIPISGICRPTNGQRNAFLRPGHLSIFSACAS